MNDTEYNFAYLDEQTRRLIRRLRAEAIAATVREAAE